MTGPPLPPHANQPVKLPARRPSDLLHGSIAVVTGGGRGLGQAIACSLADAGASVVVSGRHATQLDETVAIIRERGGRAGAELSDVSEPADAHGLVARSERHFGTPRILVNNAGVAARETARRALPPAQFDQLFATNVRGVYYACLGAAQAFAGGGSIINVSSVTARTPDPELTAYSAGKAAVESLTRTLSAAFGALSIRVNAVAPGYLDSPLNHDRVGDDAQARAVLDRTPLGRWGLPQDVADAVCFLASDRSTFITGQVLAIDGGFPTAPPRLRTASGDGKGTGDRS